MTSINSYTSLFSRAVSLLQEQVKLYSNYNTWLLFWAGNSLQGEPLSYSGANGL